MTKVKSELQESNLKILLFEVRFFQLFMAKNHAPYCGLIGGPHVGK